MMRTPDIHLNLPEAALAATVMPRLQKPFGSRRLGYTALVSRCFR